MRKSENISAYDNFEINNFRYNFAIAFIFMDIECIIRFVVIFPINKLELS